MLRQLPFLVVAILPALLQAQPVDLQKLIDEAITSGAPKVVVPQGVHRVEPSGRHAAFHLYFKNIRNFEIDGTDATLIFTDPALNGMTFDDVDGLTIRGLTIDYDPLPYTQGTITAIGTDPVTYDVKLDAGYPADEAYFTSRIAAYLYEPTGSKLKDGAFDHYVSRITQPEPGVFRLEFSNPSAAQRSGTVVGDRIIISRRAATAVRFLRSRGVNVDGMTVLAAPGMAFHEAHGEGGNRYRFTVTYGPKPAGATAERLHTANADGFHSSYMHIGPTVENCHIEGQGDDAIAIHDNYCLVTSEGESESIVLAPKYELPLEVGDELRVLDQSTYGLKHKAKVMAIEKMPAPTGEAAEKLEAMWKLYSSDVAGKTFYRITLDRPIDVAIGDLASSFDRTGARFTVRNNYIGPHRARGILIKAPFGTVESNVIEGSSFGGILMGPELTTWLGGDYAAGVTVRNNTIRRTGYAGNVTQNPITALAGAITVQARTIHNTLAANYENAGITIENNRIEEPAAAGIFVSSAKDVIIRNNTIIAPWSAKGATTASRYGVPAGSAIYVDQVKDVQIQGNSVSPPADGIPVQGKSATGVTIEPGT